MNWRDHLPIHPAAKLFPLMSEAELKELAEDIKNHGLWTPIVIWETDEEADHKRKRRAPSRYGLVDGRNRLDALALLGLLEVDSDGDLCLNKKWNGHEWLHDSTPAHSEYLGADYLGAKRTEDGDPYALALSFNVHRRHLTTEQKRELIAKLIKANPEKSNRQIADQVKASHPHVAKVRTELEKAGDVETVSTSIDTKGRKQPAKRKAVSKPAVSKAAESEPSAEDSAAARRAYYAATEESAGKPEHKLISSQDDDDSYPKKPNPELMKAFVKCGDWDFVSQIAKPITEQFGDGKWHSFEEIAAAIDAPDWEVSFVLALLAIKTDGCKCERRKFGTSSEWRIFAEAKMVSSTELIAKLTPITKGLKEEGRKNMATMSPAQVAVLAGRLQNLLDEWTAELVIQDDLSIPASLQRVQA